MTWKIVILVVFFLLGYYLVGYFIGRSSLPSLKRIRGLSDRELKLLCDVVVMERILREKTRGEIATSQAERNDKQEETKVFEEFEEDKTCKS